MLIFWVLLGLMVLALFAVLVGALRSPRERSIARQREQWIAEGEAMEAELEDRHRRTEELNKSNVAQWQERRNKTQAAQDPDRKA